MPEDIFEDLPDVAFRRQLLNADVREGTYQGVEFWFHTLQVAKHTGEKQTLLAETPYGVFSGAVWTAGNRQAWELIQRMSDGRQIPVIGAFVRSSDGKIDLFEMKKDPDGVGCWRRDSYNTPVKDWGGTQYDYVFYNKPVDFVVMFLSMDEYRSCQRPAKSKRTGVLRYEFEASREPYETLG